MATINLGVNSYSGEVLEDLLTYTAEGNDTYKEGLIHIKSDIQSKYTLPMVSLGDIIQDRKATPVSSDSVGAYQFSERYLEPQDFMVYMEFNPRDYEKYYKWAQPTGNLVFRELDPKIQATMLRLLMDKKNEYIGNSIWCAAKGGTTEAKVTAPAGGTAIGGATSGGTMKYFDGVIKRIIDNLNTTDANELAGGKCILAGSTTIANGEAVEAALNTMWQKCPKEIRKNAGLAFVMGWDLWDMYDQYLTSKTFKYTDNTQINQYRFKGKRIVPITGIAEQTILLGNFSQGMDSNLWMAVDYPSDEEVIKVDRLQSNSELYFFKMLLKMDVNIVKPKELVVWTAYTKTA